MPNNRQAQNTQELNKATYNIAENRYLKSNIHS